VFATEPEDHLCVEKIPEPSPSLQAQRPGFSAASWMLGIGDPIQYRPNRCAVRPVPANGVDDFSIESVKTVRCGRGWRQWNRNLRRGCRGDEDVDHSVTTYHLPRMIQSGAWPTVQSIVGNLR